MAQKLVVHQLTLNAKKAAHRISDGIMIFLVLIILSISFILFQLKEVQITRDIKEIRQLKNEIEELQSLNHYYKSKIKNELSAYSRIREIAGQLGLQEAREKPKVLTVPKNKLVNHVKKDEEISKSPLQ